MFESLILWYLTRLVNEVSDLKQDIKSLENKKVIVETMELKYDLIQEMFKQLILKIDSTNSKLDLLVRELSGFGTRVDDRLGDYEQRLTQHDKQLAEL